MQERNEARWLDVFFSRARPFDDRVPSQPRLAARAGLSGRARSSPTTSSIARKSGGAGAASTGGSSADPARYLPGQAFPGAPAAHARGVAPARAAPDRGLALVLRRRRPSGGVEDFLRHYYIRYSGPSGLTEQDDMENSNSPTRRAASASRASTPTTTRWAWAAPGVISKTAPPQASRRDQRRDAGQRPRARPGRLLHALVGLHEVSKLDGVVAS